MRVISASDANRNFSALLKAVAKGEAVTVLSRGRAVATIGPPAPASSAERLQARKVLLHRLQAAGTRGAREWTRDALYD